MLVMDLGENLIKVCQLNYYEKFCDFLCIFFLEVLYSQYFSQQILGIKLLLVQI